MLNVPERNKELAALVFTKKSPANTSISAVRFYILSHPELITSLTQNFEDYMNTEGAHIRFPILLQKCQKWLRASKIPGTQPLYTELAKVSSENIESIVLLLTYMFLDCFSQNSTDLIAFYSASLSKKAEEDKIKEMVSNTISELLDKIKKM